MIIGVDIDGTLTNETAGYSYKERTPNVEMIHKINLLHKENVIILFSARYRRDRKITEEWLNKYGVKYDKLILGKPRFDLYIGDEVKRPEEV